MEIEKLPVVSGRLRHIPEGFGWIDHRFVREGFIRRCSTDSVALYLVLITVGDRDGLSFYGESLICALLGWSRGRLSKARDNLVESDLLGYSDPIYQVLELPFKRSADYDNS